MGKYDNDIHLIPRYPEQQGCYENILLAGDNDQAYSKGLDGKDALSLLSCSGEGRLVCG